MLFIYGNYKLICEHIKYFEDIMVRKWICTVCGFIYDEEKGMPEEGIAVQTCWEDIPNDWECPDCGVGKSDFDMIPVH